MTQTLEIQELAIVITAKNYDPSLLNPELLKYSGVIPEDWKIAKKPIVSRRASQIVFDNRVLITSKPNSIMFIEAWNNEANESCKIVDAIKRYINVLRTVEYQAVGINFRGYVNCPNATIESNNYLFDNLIKTGDWQNCGAISIKPEVNLMFDHNDKQLNLNIKESALKLPDSAQVPIVLFNGNCHHNLSPLSLGDRLSGLTEVLHNWHQDLKLYRSTVAKFIDLDSSASEGSNAELEAAAV